MSKPETKSFDLAVKEVGDDGTFAMYAAIFGNVDRGGDVIEPGAFTNLDEFVKSGTILLNHRQDKAPIGLPLSAEQDTTGLKVTGRFHATPEAQAVRTIARERLEAGKEVQASIGYVADDYRLEQRGRQTVRVLEGVRVYEASIVNVAMNPKAGVVSAKSREARPMALDETERGLIAAIKRAVGLESKSGKAISAANHSELSRHASGMADTVANMQEHHKAMKALCKKMGEEIGEYQEKHKGLMDFLEGHKPGPKDPPDDDDDEEEEEEEDERQDGKKPKAKSVEPPPTPKPEGAPSRAEIAEKLAKLKPL